jgi:diguanylate cyclase (GGDEF)-like protein/PAS domain S-box-containing protein
MSLLESFSNLSLRLKLVLVSAVVEIIMLGLLVGNSLRLMSNTVEYHAETLVEDLSPLLDGALSLYMFERDYASMQETLEKLVKGGQSELRYIVVLDESGGIYAATGRRLDEQLPEIDGTVESAMSDKIFDAVSTLKMGTLKVGEVRFGVSLEEMINARSDLLRQGLFIASLEIILTIILLSIAGYLLTRHIFVLVDATREVANGDYTINVKKSTNDEIGQLADNFNIMTAAIRDRVEALKASEHALTEEKERILVTLNSIGDGVITTDMEGRVELLNPVAEQLTGWTQEEAEGLVLEEVFNIKNEITGLPVQNPVKKCIESGVVVGLANHTVLLRRDGHEFAIEDSAAPIRNSEGEIIGVILVFHDVSSARQMARQMAYQARHDSLTGLVNRAEFEERVNEAIEIAGVEDRQHALLYMDLDQFKIINDTCGHFAGDELLKQLTMSLKSKIRDTDTLARLGGDEFGVLLINCDFNRAGVIAESLRKHIDEFRFEWEDRQFDIAVSIGVVPITSESRSMAEVLSAADVACYIAKEKGRNRVHVHVAGDEEHAIRQGEMHLVSEISSAIDEGRFTLHYQVIQPAAGKNEGGGFYELLVRMIGKNQEIIPPFKFISAAERFHLMQQVDRWVVRESLSFIRKNQGQLQHDVFSVNLSGQSIGSNEFIEFLVNEIDNSGIDASQLCFEVTETAAIANLKNASHLILELRKLGCTFSLDDFGSGLSSFAYLKNLNADYLKIDGGFIKDILLDSADAAMVESINQIGHVMGLRTIAEYVESEAIYKAVANMGVDYVQGFAIHKPEPLINLLTVKQKASG